MLLFGRVSEDRQIYVSADLDRLEIPYEEWSAETALDTDLSHCLAAARTIVALTGRRA